MAPTLRFQILPHGEGLPLPAYQTAGAAGMDLRAGVQGDLILLPGERVAVPTGLRIAIPDGHEGQVRSRSGLVLRRGLCVINGPGTIDADYRGELKVLLANLGRQPVTVRRGDRIAQLVIAPVTRAAVAVVDGFDETSRGGGGFGSTGVE